MTSPLRTITDPGILPFHLVRSVSSRHQLNWSRAESWGDGTSVSSQCRREGNAAPRSQIFSEPINRKAGSCDSSAHRSDPRILPSGNFVRACTHRHKKVQSEPSDGAKPRPRGTNAEESGTWSEELTKHQFAARSLEERSTSTRAISNSARMRFQARRGVIRRRHYFELPIQGCASKIFVHSISSMQRVTYWLTRHLIGF